MTNSCEHYDGDGRPSDVSIARHAQELADAPWGSTSSRPSGELQGDEDFNINRTRWKDGTFTIKIYFRRRLVFTARFDPKWETDDGKIDVTSIDRYEWAERFMEIDCLYAKASLE